PRPGDHDRVPHAVAVEVTGRHPHVPGEPGERGDRSAAGREGAARPGGEQPGRAVCRPAHREARRSAHTSTTATPAPTTSSPAATAAPAPGGRAAGPPTNLIAIAPAPGRPDCSCRSGAGARRGVRTGAVRSSAHVVKSRAAGARILDFAG